MKSIGAGAQLLSNDVQAQWIIEQCPFRIQLSSIFPFRPIDGDALCYAATGELPRAAALDFNGAIAVNTVHPQQCNRVFPIAELATQFRVSYKAQDVFSSNANDQTSVQMALAIRQLLYRFWMMFETGDARNAGEFDGLSRLVSPGQVVDLDFKPLTLEALDRAKEKVRSNDGRRVVALTSSLGKRAIHAAYWSRGLEPQYQVIEVPCGDADERFEQVLGFDGAPVYVNDLNQTWPQPENTHADSAPPAHEPQNPSEGCDIWFFVLGENNLHGLMPAALDTGLFVTRSTLMPDASSLVYHVKMPVGIALGSDASLAVVRNATMPG